MSNYFKFIESNRPEIGLSELYDLSEIYDSDQRFALLNLGLNPEGLDQIFDLSNIGLTKEDIRTMGGLETSVINSLALSNITLKSILFDQRNHISVDRPIGEPGKHSFTSGIQSDNIIVLHGGLAAKSIIYNFLDEEGNKRSTNVSVSRESLFNAERDNNFKFVNAEYSGLLRVRRRSHVNNINLSAKIVRPKGSIVESPTHVINIPTYMRTQANTNPSVQLIKSYSVKNSPLVLPVRISNTATISFSREPANSQSPGFVFGWELKRYSDLSTVRSASINSVGAVSRVNININVVGTIGNNIECLLYIYLDPTQVIEADLSGLGLRELAGKDIGLVGFTSLKRLNISNNRLSTVPVWLKTLYSQLQYLDIRSNPFWQNGIVSVFDYQDMSGIAGVYSGAVPTITLSQVLGYSGYDPSGRIIAYTGAYDTVQDIAGNLYKDTRRTNQTTIDAANGFRVFNQLSELILGNSIYIDNGDFSKLFPNLTNFNASTAFESQKTIRGLPPKINNNGGLTTYAVGYQRLCSGGLNYIGNGENWNGTVDNQFIGQFNMASFSAYYTGMNGGICTDASDVIGPDGSQRPGLHHIISGDVQTAWSGWLNNAVYIDVGENNIAIKIAKSNVLNWQKLQFVRARRCGVNVIGRKVKYNPGDTLMAPELRTIDAHAAGWWGNLFKIDSDTSKLTSVDASYNEWRGYIDNEGREYLLPEDFTDPSTSQLTTLNLKNIYESFNNNLELRADDINNMPKLTYLSLTQSYIRGVFPNISTNSQNQNTTIRLDIESCRFRNLNSIGSSNTNRVNLILAYNQGTGVGGALLPSFSSPLNTQLQYINFNNSLSSTYPSNWGVIEDRNKLIVPLASENSTESNTPNVTWSSRNNNNTASVASQKLYASNSAFNIFSEVMVGDLVSGTGIPSQTRVTQIDPNGFIYVNNVVNITNVSLTFRRFGQDISSYFSNHANLGSIYASNCRITGEIPRFINTTNLVNIVLSNNLLSSYVSGTLENITGVNINRRTRPSLRNFILNNNPLSINSIRNIISEAHDIAVYFSQYNITPLITINLLQTKLDSANKGFINYSSNEIINDVISPKYEQLGPGKLYPGINISIF